MTTSLHTRFRPLLAGLLVLGVVLSACGGDDSDEAAPEPSTTTAPTTTTTAPTTTTTAPEPPGSMIAQAHGTEIAIYDEPGAAEPSRILTDDEAVSVPGAVPIVFLVAEDAGEWLKVNLPVRPNGSTGWVRASDVDTSRTTYRVEVQLSAHRVKVFDGDQVILDEAVGVGRTDRPTPGGVYYIKELLQPPSPNGAYGPYAYGLSGFSNVLQTFGDGNGVIGLHGTNDPSAIGRDVSSGCIRMPNDRISYLVENVGLPLGTPVEIIA